MRRSPVAIRSALWFSVFASAAMPATLLAQAALSGGPIPLNLEQTLATAKGASIVYVKGQMGHSSIQVTVDTCGHLIPGANVSFVDRLDVVEPAQKTTLQQNATQAHQAIDRETAIPADLLI
jgi:hypothetical protein